jgi:glyoxylase-like metal-dependent hydrolase (beta-lactamase superfamily II)
MTKDESRAPADWVVAAGKNVTAIFVTHAHGDHFFGAPAVLERFPDARVVAAPGVAARMDAHYGPRFDLTWGLRFPGCLSFPARLNERAALPVIGLVFPPR